MSRPLALAALTLLLSAAAHAQTKKEGEAGPSLPPSLVPESARNPDYRGAAPAEAPKAFDGAVPGASAPAPVPREPLAPAPPDRAPALDGRALGPAVKGPVEPDPQLEPVLLAAPVPVDKPLFDKVLTHVRKYCSPDEDSGLCCLSGQAPLKKKAPARTACLEIGTPVQNGDIQQAVYREVFLGLTIVTTAAKGRSLEHTTLEMGMDGSVAQAEMEAEDEAGLQRRADPMQAKEARDLFDSAAKDLLLITPRVRT